MVAVAQLVESRIVIPVVVGSSPISHPMNSLVCPLGTVDRLAGPADNCRQFWAAGLTNRPTRLQFAADPLTTGARQSEGYDGALGPD